ncbi:hypothetical protein [Actinoallomurus rhizosphaericola]|uniref:hypothetical protein n=1 Tax=Actinoallomurus rhizosphaericola TaxID=2952536 RepID=UPI002090DCC4|nr:hypothetical protein [Actinoallomurus rhizosphaericola]MCO5992826.1 hypothetical protein [Actinoallomurus rhizosphaericola]
MPPVNANSAPLQTYNDWPGIDDHGKLRVDTSQVRAVANKLEGLLEHLLAASERLKPLENPEALGTWDAALGLQPSVEAGHHALAEQHSRILHALLSTIHKLHQAANVHDANEANLARRIAALDKRLHVAPGGSAMSYDFSPTSAPPKSQAPVANSLNPDGRH